MKSRLAGLFLMLNFGILLTSFSDDIKIQKVFDVRKENFCISQDKDGLLWIGSEGNGLFCYDGDILKKAKIYDEDSFKSIYSILVDRKGLIWFFMEGEGLFSFDKENGAYSQNKAEDGNQNSLTNNSAHWLPSNMAEDKEGLIWVGTIDGLNSYNKQTGKFTQYKHDPNNANSISNNSIWVVFVDKDGLVWIGTEAGLNCYDKRAGRFHCYKHDSDAPNSISDSYVRAIAEDKDGNLWVGTKNNGIDKFDKKTGKFTNSRHNPHNKNSLSYDEIHHIMVDKFNTLWICNEGNKGVDRYDIKTNTFSNYSHNSEDPNTIGSNNISCTFEDNSGIVWLIDTSSSTITKCLRRNNVFKNYSYDSTNPFSISSIDIVRLCEDKMQNIWIGTVKGGLCLYTKDGKFTSFSHIPNDAASLPTNSIDSILEAQNGKIWLGLEEGYISLFDTNTKKVIKNFKNPYYATPCYLTQDNKNPELIWFGCFYTEGLFNLNTATGEFTRYKNTPHDIKPITNKNTTHILQDGDVLWICTGGNGLCKFNKITGKYVYYRHNPDDKNSISGNVLLESFIDSKGNFWITTNDGGLNRFDKQSGKFTSYSVACGFPNKSTRHILEDKKGFLWISTDSGIVKFDPKTLKVVKRFTDGDGLASSHFDKLANPLKDSSGNFWFSTLKGLCRFNPEAADKMEPNSHIPPIVLSSFKSKEGTYNEDGLKNLTDIRLAWPDNSFEFTFAALDYMNPEKNQYAYMLEGFDKAWNYIRTYNFGRYTNIPPGEYILRLKGSNNDGVWNEKGLSIKITIAPAFWMAWWFKGLVIAVFLSIIFGIYRLKIRELKKRAGFLEEHNIRLNREIEERKKAESELSKTMVALHKAEFEAEKKYAVAEMAAQVAHDIRSPLISLSMISKTLPELPEEKRILIRNATERINDIANNLLEQHKVKKNEAKKRTETDRDLKPELVSILLDSLASEKRIQMERLNVDFTLEIENNAHSSFVRLDSNRFKRMISNLINNSVEALHDSEGMVRLTLEKESDTLVIKIIDNGQGIPTDILPEIKKGGVSVGKEGGIGLGIAGAIQNIKDWNGSYDVLSEHGKGTTFIIKLPITEAPAWFQSTITIALGQHVVVLDDDESIHDVWKTRFQDCLKNKQITLYNFRTPLDFCEYCETLASENDFFLIDYELLRSKETGLDLIEKFNLEKQSTLVTSRYEEPEIRERVNDMGIKIIPKILPHIFQPL